MAEPANESSAQNTVEERFKEDKPEPTVIDEELQEKTVLFQSSIDDPHTSLSFQTEEKYLMKAIQSQKVVDTTEESKTMGADGEVVIH